jgi:hypothetical protein
MDNQLTIQQAIVRIASKYTGIKEIPQNRGWKNKDFEKKMKAIGWKAPQSWCMYFVKLVLIEAYEAIGDTKMAEWCHKHLNGGVMSSWRKLKPQMTIVPVTEPEAGLIGFMQNDGKETGHAFVIERVRNLDEIVTIEGNTDASVGLREGDGVYRRTRWTDNMLKNKLKLVGYIRMR